MLQKFPNIGKDHCVKNVRIRSYSGSHFPVFGLNTERYSVSECAKITPNASRSGHILWKALYRQNCRPETYESATSFKFGQVKWMQLIRMHHLKFALYRIPHWKFNFLSVPHTLEHCDQGKLRYNLAQGYGTKLFRTTLTLPAISMLSCLWKDRKV